MPITEADREDHVALGVNSIFAVVPKDRPAFAPVLAAVPSLVEGFNRDEATFKPEAFAAARERRFEPFIGGTSVALSAATGNAREVETARRTALTPPPAVAEDAIRYGPEIRDRFRSLEGPGPRRAFIESASPAAMAALLVADGSLAELSDDEADRARELAMPAFHAIRTGAAGAHPKRPTLEGGLIVTGIDNAAATAQAGAAMTRFRERVAGVERDEAALKSLVAFIAAALEVDQGTALERVVAAS